MARAPGRVAALAVLGVVVAAAAEVVAEGADIEEEAGRVLALAADLRVRQVEAWRTERLADGASIAAHPLVARAARQAQDVVGALAAREDLRLWGESRMKRPDYAGVAILGSKGEVLVPAGLPADRFEDAGSLEGRRRDDVWLSDFHRDGIGVPHVDLVVPLRLGVEEPRRVGTVVLRIDPGGLFETLAASQPGGGAETLLVRREGEQVELLTPPRHGRAAPLPRRLPVDDPELTVAAAARGQAGPLIGKDCCGHAVLAAARKVPGTEWTLVVERDRRDVQAALAARGALVAAVATSLVVAILLTTSLWSRRRQEEQRLSEAREEAKHRRAADELRDSEARFHAAFHDSGMGAAVVDRQGMFLDVNPALAATLGYSAGELQAMSYSDFLHPEDAGRSTEAFAQLVAGERDHDDMQCRYLRKDGQVVHLRCGVTAVRAPGGAFQQAVAIVEDVTCRVRVDAEIRRNEEWLRLVLEATEKGVWDLDVPSGTLRLSAQLQVLLGQEVVDGATTLGVVAGRLHPTDRPDFEARVQAVLSGTEPRFEREYRIVGRDGEWRWLRVNGKVVERDDRGSALRAVGSAADITDRKKLEASLALADRMASIGVLAAGVAHEVNNPLAYSIANVGFVRDRLRRLRQPPGAGGASEARVPDTLLGEMMVAIGEAGEGLERVRLIVRDIKTFSRAGEVSGPIDVGAVLEAAIRVANREIVRRARLVRDLQPVPRVHANESRLGQVILNLLVNAAHAIPDGAVGAHEVRVSTRHLGDQVAIAVCDTGCGIPGENLRLIFDPFFTTKPPGTGTGLGLAVSAEIVRGIGGRIEVESEPGRGSTFTVWIPAWSGGTGGVLAASSRGEA